MDQNYKVRELKVLSFPWGLGSLREGVDPNRKGLTAWENGGQGLYIGIIEKYTKRERYFLLMRSGKSGAFVLEGWLSCENEFLLESHVNDTEAPASFKLYILLSSF